MQKPEICKDLFFTFVNSKHCEIEKKRDIMKDRIAHIMRAKNLKASDFASLLGIQPSAVSHILAGRNKPSLEIVRKIKETFPEYNLDWIIFGTGPVTTSEPFKEASKDASTGNSRNTSSDAQNASSVPQYPSSGPQNTSSVPQNPSNNPQSAPLSSQDTPFQASLFELETDEETAVEDSEKPEKEFHRFDSRVPISSSGIRSIVIFYEDGTFESFLPR